MMNRILVAVDDSPPSLAAAGYAIDLVCSHPAELRFAMALEPGRDADAVLHHVHHLAAKAGLVTTTATCNGAPPFDALLAEARRWNADLIVMGRSDMRRPGRRYVGSQTEHVLEFTEIPVLVVPVADTSGSGRPHTSAADHRTS
ncbi:MAG: universal stress protein [Ilumatobacteraceae bacterium]|jgi:nucleotide-binding universal stress UspA family protein